VIVAPPGGKLPCADDCTDAAEDLLEYIGLEDPDVKRVRVKKVVPEVDLKGDDCVGPQRPKRPHVPLEDLALLVRVPDRPDAIRAYTEAERNSPTTSPLTTTLSRSRAAQNP
jgi:hypothetical protein